MSTTATTTADQWLDHVVLASTDPTALVSLWQSLGFSVADGSHPHTAFADGTSIRFGTKVSEHQGIAAIGLAQSAICYLGAGLPVSTTGARAGPVPTANLLDVLGIEGVTGIHSSPHTLAASAADGFGLGHVRLTAGRLDISLNGQSLRLLTPERFARRYPGAAFAAAPNDWRVLTLRCNRLAAAYDWLVARGCTMLDVAGERLVLAPDGAAGVALELAAR